MERRQAVEGRNADEQHRSATGDAVGGDDDGGVALHEVLVQEDPAERDHKGEDDEEVARKSGSWFPEVRGGRVACA